MLTYPALLAALDGRDLDRFASDLGLTRPTLDALLAGGRAVPLGDRARIAHALRADVDELFRLVPDLEEALPAEPNRYVTDPTVLRLIDRPKR